MKQYISTERLRKLAQQDITGYGDNTKPYCRSKVKEMREALRDAASQIERLKLELGFNDSRMGIMQDRIDRLKSVLARSARAFDETLAMFTTAPADHSYCARMGGKDDDCVKCCIENTLDDDAVFGRFESKYEEVRTGVIVEKNPCSEIALKSIDSLPFGRFLNPGNKLS